MLEQNIELLKNGASELGIILNEKQICDIELFEQELFEWNKVMNLTSIKDPKDIVTKHFIDSFTVLKYVQIPPESKVIDVGTGAGFPGIPIKIVRNDIDITYLDSTNKKLNFIINVMNKLEYSKWDAVHNRAEEAGSSEVLREKFDFVTARAVAELKILTEYCLPLVKVGGAFIAMKGEDKGSEVAEAKNAIRLLGGEIENIFNFTLPYTDFARSLIIIRKKSKTPAKFPRLKIQINKEPL
jgi:16S rRNA (guanine527-N7)-methyltransferase